MPRFSHLVLPSLLGLASISFAAQAQQGGKPAENGGKMLKKAGKVSARMLREDERAERTGTVRADGRMTKKPEFIREEDRLAHRKQPPVAPAPPKRKHTTLE